jgi:hypothetical protein
MPKHSRKFVKFFPNPAADAYNGASMDLPTLPGPAKTHARQPVAPDAHRPLRPRGKGVIRWVVLVVLMAGAIGAAVGFYRYSP